RPPSSGAGGGEILPPSSSPGGREVRQPFSRASAGQASTPPPKPSAGSDVARGNERGPAGPARRFNDGATDAVGAYSGIAGGRATARGLRGERADAASSARRDGATDLVGADGGIAGGDVVGGTHGDSLRLRARGKVREALRLRPLRRVVFGWVLRHARVRVRD